MSNALRTELERAEWQLHCADMSRQDALERAERAREAGDWRSADDAMRTAQECEEDAQKRLQEIALIEACADEDGDE